MKKLIAIAFAQVAVCCIAFGQVSQPQPSPSRAPAQTVAVPSSMVPIGPEMSLMLSRLESTTQQTAMDVGKLSVKKWKTEASLKDQAQHDINSVQSNITGTLPGLLAQVRSNPDNTAMIFKLYRNVDALLEVVRGLAESAGAFGSKSEFDTLQTDSQNISSVRATLASQLDAVATAKETELTRVKAQLAQAQAAATPSVPKKIVVDDNAPAKKATKKKKTTSSTQSGTNPKQ